MEEQFLARLTENPSDKASWGVYADFLQTTGDQRGEVLALELAGKKEAAEQLRETLCRGWVGTVTEEYTEEGHWDYNEPTPTRMVNILDLGPLFVQATWWGPFIQELRLGQGQEPHYDDSGYSYQVYGRPTPEEIFRATLPSPACRLLQSLHLQLGEDLDWAPFFPLLPKSLRVLHLGTDDPQWGYADHPRDISSLFELLPHLEQLSIQGTARQFRISPQRPCPQLTTLRFRMPDLNFEHLLRITPEFFPNLEHLTVEALWSDYYEQRLLYHPQDADALRFLEMFRQTREALLGLLQHDFPRLRELKIGGIGSGLATVRALQNCPVIPRLKWLEVSGCALEQALPELIVLRARWHHLSHLGLELLGKEKDVAPLKPFARLERTAFQ